LALYARGLSTRDIQGHVRELYGTEVAPDPISRVTRRRRRRGHAGTPSTRRSQSRGERVGTRSSPLLAYPNEARRILYATHVFESLHFQMRKVLEPQGAFPSNDAVTKILSLALQHTKVRWKPPVTWKQAPAHFAIRFGARFPV
jgi:transposase-like protein